MPNRLSTQLTTKPPCALNVCRKTFCSRNIYAVERYELGLNKQVLFKVLPKKSIIFSIYAVGLIVLAVSLALT